MENKYNIDLNNFLFFELFDPLSKNNFNSKFDSIFTDKAGLNFLRFAKKLGKTWKIEQFSELINIYIEY